ncbi:3-dehydroshikimate dehydratase [Aspergillus japonicus CBS 114.51]|uniref:3-dehydroshikimate dehydratase n=1 Tax=Aspergillus japonicus CBS 114.51 TaxID=1448312 RepID=A0A8T8WLA7_ASPJA|nr:3-dehydroshikimate dehydratase [Aspergillus japonicus CBS 114.51]RAH76493.1 3-dehydroshikimate dehydratase [Aspergillus japonicus CBS 114.51]
MPNRLGIASMSLGRPGIHSLSGKLHQAALHGYEGIELFFDDLDHFAKTLFQGDHAAAAKQVRRLCDSLGLSIICLQPFSFYEGLLDRAESERMVTEKLPRWFELARILDTDLIQIPSNFLLADPATGELRTTGDRRVIVADLQRVADLGLQQSPPFRFVYEALCWGNHVDTWDASWEVVQQVDRPNFGLCLDTFNLAGRVYADPAHPSGKTPNAEADLAASLAKLRACVDVKKVFYIQIVDGERLSAPLDEAHPFHVPGQPTRMNWSRNARLFAFEEDRGGYLPVQEVAQAFFDTGFEGWVSLELFSRTLADPHPDTPKQHALRGLESWKKLVTRLGLKDASPSVSYTPLASPAVETPAPASPLQHRL